MSTNLDSVHDEAGHDHEAGVHISGGNATLVPASRVGTPVVLHSWGIN